MTRKAPVDSPLASDSLTSAGDSHRPPSPRAANAAGRQVDLQILSQLKRGNWSAMDDLVRRYQDRLFTTILRMVGHPEDAADLVQETFVRAIQNISSFEGKSTLYTWLFRIAINLSLTHRRAAKYRQTTPLQPPDTVNRQADSLRLEQRTEPDPALDADTRIEHERLLEQLAALPQDLRAILVLRDIEDCDYEEIGVILDLPAGTVKSRLFRARAALRECRNSAAPQEHKSTP